MFCLYRQFENMYCVIPFGGSSRTMKLIYGEKKKKIRGVLASGVRWE